MATTTPETLDDVQVLRHQARVVHGVVRMNVEGLTHEESLIQPEPAGNCLNWVIGHLVDAYEKLLPVLGGQPALEDGALARYERGSAPITDGEDAWQLQDLLAAWDETSKRVSRALESLTEEDLAAGAPQIPGVGGDGTLRSLLSATLFHQCYHAGQTGLLRRLAGKEGAIP